MGPFVWWDLLWLGLVVTNLYLFYWSTKDSKRSFRMLFEAEQMIERHQVEVKKTHDKSIKAYDTALAFLNKAEETHDVSTSLLELEEEAK